MRARRAATCMGIARSAVARGRIDEAIERLEEACQLDPDAAEARLLLEELRASEPSADNAVVAGGRSDLSGWSHWLAAGIAISALSALAFFWPDVAPARGAREGAVPAPREIQRVRPADDIPSAVDRAPEEIGLSARIVEEPIGTAGSAASGDVETVPDSAPSSSAAAGEAKPAAQSSRSADLAGDVVEPSTAISAQASPPTSEVAPAEDGRNSSSQPLPPATVQPSEAPALPPLERAAVASEELRLSPADPAPARATPSAASSDAVDAARASAAGTATLGVQDVLHRYADAYGRLDAAAARAVWPTVDQRALARAFEGLESQGIVFEHCDVAVNGDAATAACRGQARYVTKVGSREPLVERRLWTFQLRRIDSTWQILDARAR